MKFVYDISKPEQTVLICGDREWDDMVSIVRELSKLSRNSYIIHGISKGADKLAGEVARELKFIAVRDVYNGKYGYLKTTHEVVDEIQPDLILAFHKDINHSVYTNGMVTYARNKGYTVKIISE